MKCYILSNCFSVYIAAAVRHFGHYCKSTSGLFHGKTWLQWCMTEHDLYIKDMRTDAEPDWNNNPSSLSVHKSHAQVAHSPTSALQGCVVQVKLCGWSVDQITVPSEEILHKDVLGAEERSLHHPNRSCLKPTRNSTCASVSICITSIQPSVC